MQIELDHAGRKIAQELQHALSRERAGPAQAKNRIRHHQPRAARLSAQEGEPRRNQSPSKLRRNAQSLKAELPSDRYDLAGDDRMKMKMFVRIGVVELQSATRKGFELGFDFGPHL